MPDERTLPTTKRYAPALRLHLLPRVVSYALVVVMLLLHAPGVDDPRLHYALAAFALAYPWLAQVWALRRADEPWVVNRLFVADGVNAGLGMAVFGFAPFPSLYLLGVTLGNTIAFGGVRDTLKEVVWVAASALAWWLLLGYRDAPAVRSVDVLAMSGFIAYILLLGYNTHVVARRLRSTTRQLREQTEALERASRTDPLTGAANRRHLYERMNTVSAPPWALILIDLDHFKSINDRHGHDAGDRTLCATVERLRAQFPPPDLVVRWGGEEFLVVVESPPAAELTRVLAQLLQAMSREPVPLADGRRLDVTCSAGAVRPAGGHADWGRWLALADLALYQAKAQGRNRACHLDVGALPAADSSDADLPQAAEQALATVLGAPPAGGAANEPFEQACAPLKSS
jgi:diguanylate cyclase (GGDEF)-like protein